MMNKIKFYNTLSRKVEQFRPENPQEIKIYTCGPTVYSEPHVGNFAAYIYWDLLVRMLKAHGFGIKRVLNLTDVGHLASDGDEGEDKLEKGARKTGKSVWDVAEFYIARFLEDYRALNLTEPDVLARATDYVADDIGLVDLLTEKGYTYETADGIYFDTSKFPTYADFAKLDLKNLKAGARVEFSHEKKHPSDFAVWKFIQPGEQHAMRWEYLDRPGYPGWHLECSTIIHVELGEPIDIHAGGIDHIPVHHTNEIAQSEAAFGKKLANYWLHCNHITSEGQKISKSLGNGYTLSDLAAHGFSPLDFKMWVLQGHYSSERDFSLDGLEAARSRRLNWRNRVAESYQTPASGNAEVVEQVLAALSDNLNSPQAFALIDGADDLDLVAWEKLDAFLGLGLIQDSPRPNANQQALLDQRQTARNEKNFTESDRLRNQLMECGLNVLDTPNGQIWQYLR